MLLISSQYVPSVQDLGQVLQRRTHHSPPAVSVVATTCNLVTSLLTFHLLILKYQNTKHVVGAFKTPYKNLKQDTMHGLAAV